ncbi:tRNA1(Val) (adenine(37)-N6)-methyltransferase [Sphingobacterium suaedae]|uniref:tRNA1(Val) (adenine(37)-N6)-methyltransferase n=1 Tax=Sphingobacterium suaedae TaxID=1686402 RepID=A0ABW5KGJ0_9SPHI
MGSIFRFKQFEVEQGNCAMRINTDGVLLGGLAWHASATHILDIGTGTGVIAMMLAQRHPQAVIDAVEIDAEACEQAATNFRGSRFADRLHVFQGSFVDLHPTKMYDLIVSNPPFYTHSLHNPDPRKRLAKHTDDLFFVELLNFVQLYLSDTGHFECIVPTALAETLVGTMLENRGLHLQSEWTIRSFPDETPIRKLLRVGKAPLKIERNELSIYLCKGEYSERYKDILQPYFLAF